jgi:hypothetical protein
MNTHEGCADPRPKIGAIVVEAIRGVEAKLGMSIYEYAGKDAKFPTKGKRAARFRTNMPYCFIQLDGGGWLPLNRFYRPLGQVPNGGVGYEGCADRGDKPAPISSRPGESGGYEGYAHLAVHFPTDPRTVSGVWRSQTETQLWLYNDDPAVRRTYFERFARLLAAMDTWRVDPAVLSCPTIPGDGDRGGRRQRQSEDAPRGS